MKKEKITLIIYVLMGIGAVLVVSGVGLIIFTDIYLDQGADGVLLVASLIASGLFLLLPAKIFLTLMLMQKNDEKQRNSNSDANADKD